MSPDDGSCHSSRISNKSEKNMADFDGEEALSEDELAQIHAQAQYSNPHITPHLSSMASLYHSHLPKCKALHLDLSLYKMFVHMEMYIILI